MPLNLTYVRVLRVMQATVQEKRALTRQLTRKTPSKARRSSASAVPSRSSADAHTLKETETRVRGS